MDFNPSAEQILLTLSVIYAALYAAFQLLISAQIAPERSPQNTNSAEVALKGLNLLEGGVGLHLVNWLTKVFFSEVGFRTKALK